MQVLVARIGKPHGIRGEVTVQLFTDIPEERFAPGEVLDLENFTPKSPVATVAPTGRLKVVGHRWNKKILVVRFEEVTTRNQAEELRGSRLMFEVPEDEDDEGFYEQELVNLPVYLLMKVPEGENPVNNPKAGKPLGKDILLVKLAAEHGGDEIMIPFVEEIVPEVVTTAEDEPGFVLLTPPPGLINVAEAESAASNSENTGE